MKSFETLLNTLKTSCPDVITEAQAAELLDDFNDGIEQMKLDSSETGKATGFQEGYEEGKKVAEDRAKEALNKLMTSLDEEATTKLKEIVELVDSANSDRLDEIYEILTKKYANKISTIDDEHTEKLQQIVDNLDDDYTEKLQQIVEGIDLKHTEKLNLIKEGLQSKYKNDNKLALEQLDDEHHDKLQQIVEGLDKDHINKFQYALKVVTEQRKKSEDQLSSELNLLKEERENKLNTIGECVEGFLNYTLQQHLPTKQLINEQKYNAMVNTVEQVGKLLKANKVIQESEEGVLETFENTINEQKEKINKLIKENIDSQGQIKSKEAQLVLEQKIVYLTPKAQQFMRDKFKNCKDPKVISEQIDSAVAAFRSEQSKRRDQLVKNVEQKVKSSSTMIVEDKHIEKPIDIKKPVEVPQRNSNNDLINTYVKMLQGKK